MDRIVVLVNGLHALSGGGVTYLRNLLPALAGDPELELHLCLRRGQEGPLAPMDGRIQCHYLDFRDGFVNRLVKEQTALPALARRIGARVTFSPANFGPLLAPGRVIVLRNALAVGREERRPAKRLYWFALAFMTKLSLLGCRRAIAVSEYARGHLAAGLPASVRDRVRVVHHGVDPLFQAAGEGHERGDFMLAVADLYIQKNLHRLLLAVDRLKGQFPDLRLKVAGRAVDADYAARLGRIIEDRDLGRHVEMLGHVQPRELAGLYGSCALFVFPSTVETFGNPLVEAMASGAPIVSSNTAAMPEVLGDAALLFDPRDVDGMAEQLARALGDGDLRKRLGEKSLARAREFSWQKAALLTARVIKECAQP